MMGADRGAALIVALMTLAFLTILGGALLTSTTIELTIGGNYRVNTQLLYLAEAGLDRAREQVRTLNTPAVSVTQILTNAAGADGILSTSNELQALIDSDDVAIYDNEVLTDASGATIGRYYAFIRNDTRDGRSAIVDTNDVISIISVGRIGTYGIRRIEADLKKGRFPKLPAALTLDGPVGVFDPTNSVIFNINGNDAAGVQNENAVGVISAADDAIVSGEVAGPPDRSASYTGDGPGIPNIENISGELDSQLTTPIGLESIVSSIASAATTTYSPAFNGSQSLGSFGTALNPQVVVVNGDCTFGPGTGHGILVVRGVLTVSGNFTFNGMILIIGQGEVHWNGGGSGEINGGIFIAKSRGVPRNSSQPIGPVLATRGDIVADFNGGGGNGIFYNTSQIANANRSFPFSPISYREW